MGRIARDLKQGQRHEDGDSVKMRMSKRHRKESTSEEWRLRALRRILTLFAALVVSLTLTAAASAERFLHEGLRLGRSRRRQPV